MGISSNAFLHGDRLYTIFGHGGWLERQRHVLICVLRSSSPFGSERVRAGGPPHDGKGSVFTCSTRPHFHKTKPALQGRNPSPFTACPIRPGALRECFHLIFWSRGAVIHILYMGTGSQCSLGELWPISVRLNCALICRCVVGFYCVGKDVPKFQSFLLQRSIVRE